MIKYVRKTLSIVVIIIGFMAINTFINFYKADVSYKLSQRSLDSGELSLAFDYIEDALKLNQFEPNYYRGRARILIASLITPDEELARLLKIATLKDLESAYNLNPSNLVTMRNLVPLYYFVAVKDISIPASDTNVDADFLPYAKDYFKTIENASPNDVGVYVLLARYQKRLGLTQYYEENVNRIKALRPDLLDWYEGLK